MRKSPVSCLMRKSHVSRENLMSYQFWVPPPTRKSPVSCLMGKSHVSRENLMSNQFLVPPQQENLLSLVSWQNLMFKKKTSCLFSFGSPQWENLLSPVSWENLMSHEIFLWDLWRKHHTWEFLMRQEIFFWDRRQETFSLGGRGAKLIRRKIFSWDIKFSHKTGDRRFSH